MFRILDLITNYAYFSVLHFKNTFIKYSEISVKCIEGSLFICDLLLLIVLSFFYPQCRALQGSVASLTRLYSPVQVRRIRPQGN